MISKANIDLAGAASGFTRPAASPQSLDQILQGFSESLASASKASSPTDSAISAGSKTSRRQKSTSEDGADSSASNGPAIQPPVLSQQTVPTQPTLQVQNALPTFPAVSSTLGPLGLSSDASVSLLKAGDHPQTESVVLAGGNSQNTENQVAPLSINENVGPNNAETSGSTSGQRTSQDALLNSDPHGSGSSLPNTIGNALSSAIASSIPAQDPAQSMDSVQGSFQALAASEMPNSSLKTALNALSSGVLNPPLKAMPSEPGDTTPNTISDRNPNGDSGAAPTSKPDSISSTIKTAVSKAPLSADPVPVLRAAFNAVAKGVVASVVSSVSAGQAIPLSAEPVHSVVQKATSALNVAVQESIQPTWLGSGFLATSQTIQSSQNTLTLPKSFGTTGVSDITATNDFVGLKQHLQSSDQQGSQAGVPSAAPSGSGSSVATYSQGQGAVVPQISVANSAAAVMAGAQNPVGGPQVQVAATLGGGTDRAAKTPAPAAPASTASSQGLPVINSAKLIQSMGQSEMRVGMRSNEFGSISISTSATRDLISAQITVDHGELAKTLAVHLPEMQARLGTNQVMDVRIDMNGTGTGHGGGTSSSMSNNSADDSQSTRQQERSTASSNAGDNISERQFSPAVAAQISGDRGVSSRLDIRV